MSTPYGAPMPADAPTCARHPDRMTYVTCQRCGRPACPECQVPAAVGVHCVDCVRAAARATPVGAPRAGTPAVTYGLTATLVVVYLLQQVLPQVTMQAALVPVLAWREPWRVLTSALVHDPTFPVHLMGNALMLVLLGQYVERALGRLRYALVMLLSALGGSTAVLWFAQPPLGGAPRDLSWVTPVLGFSTVGYGLMTTILVLLLRRGGDVRGALTLLGINVVLTLLVAGISWQGHLGGALGGLVAAFVLDRVGTTPRRAALVGVLAVAAFAAAFVARFTLVPAAWGGLA